MTQAAPFVSAWVADRSLSGKVICTATEPLLLRRLAHLDEYSLQASIHEFLAFIPQISTL